MCVCVCMYPRRLWKYVTSVRYMYLCSRFCSSLTASLRNSKRVLSKLDIIILINLQNYYRFFFFTKKDCSVFLFSFKLYDEVKKEEKLVIMSASIDCKSRAVLQCQIDQFSVLNRIEVFPAFNCIIGNIVRWRCVYKRMTHNKNWSSFFVELTIVSHSFFFLFYGYIQ